MRARACWGRVAGNYRGVVWHDVLVESCDEPYAFHIEDALIRLSGIQGIGWGPSDIASGSVMPDWHDLDVLCLRSMWGSWSGPGYIRTQRGVVRYVITPEPASTSSPYSAHLARLPTSLSRFPSLPHLAA